MDNKKQKIPFFCRHLPKSVNLLIFFILFFPTVYLCVRLGDALFIIWRYGMKAYSDGLRFQNSHLGILKNGEELKWQLNVPRVIFDLVLAYIFIAIVTLLCDLCYGWFQRIKKNRFSSNKVGYRK